MTEPDPKRYETEQEYVDACVKEEDYGYCNPMKAKFAAEAEEDARDRWKSWHE